MQSDFALSDWISHHADVFPDRIAITDLGSDRVLSYRELDIRTDRLAAYLQSRGVHKGDRVALLSYNGSEFFELQFACGRIGAIAVMLNWRLTVKELEYIIDDSDPVVLIYNSAFRDTAIALEKLTRLEALLEIDQGNAASAYEQALAAYDTPALEAVALSDANVIMYTSGTTGKPKGAIITHGMNLWSCINIGVPFGITHKSVQAIAGPLFHGGGYNCFGNPILHAGGHVILLKTFDAKELLRLIHDPKVNITHCSLGPAVYQLLSQHPDFATTDFSRLEVAVVGGAPCTVPVLETFAKKGVVLRPIYGMTEAPVPVATLNSETALAKIGVAGRPLVHSRIMIADRDAKPVQQGESGEIWIGGPNVTPGYWGKPDATAEAFSNGWLKSGDVGRFDEDGFLYVVDRWRDMYISGGENVYPAEVEKVLYSLPEIAHASVVGVPDDKWGETGLAAIVLKDGATVEIDAIKTACRAVLAKYKVPTHVWFLDQLPRNAMQKVQKHKLRKMFSQSKH